MKKLIQLSKTFLRLKLVSESRMVNELIKTAVPLEDVAEISSGEFAQRRFDREFPTLNLPLNREKSEPSVGHGTMRGEEKLQLAKKIMERTKDNWVFLPFDDVRSVEREVNSEEFADWLKEKKYPSNYRILIIKSKPIKGDYETIGWIFHDIIGHSIDNYFVSLMRFPRGISEFSNLKGVKELLEAIWNSLPPTMQNSANPKDATDKISDILASIIFEDLTEEGAIAIAESLEKDTEGVLESTKEGYTAEVIIRGLFEAADLWLKNLDDSAIKIGENKVNIVE
jgi:hypothetical protein